MSETAGATAAAIPPPAAVPGNACENCGAPLLGPHCYRCGQPVSGLVRHFSSVMGDFLDSVLNIDTRVFHTLWPLFAKPAYLSCEYFAGRRVRYVSPVRLFVFLSIVTFFIARLTINIHGDAIQLGGGDAIARATTIVQVEQARDAAIAAVAAAGQAVPGDAHGLPKAQAAIRDKAVRRIAVLRDAASRGQSPPDDDAMQFQFDGTPWNPATHPYVVQWLPDAANSWINAEIGRAKGNLARMQADPSLFKDAMLSAVPSTLFVLLPVFALMLKLLYAFRRRLYMEHLIVALHSHAFLCLTLLLVFLVMALRDWLAPATGALHAALGLVEAALFVWMPVYLLLMQKRVYRQGWLATSFKYCVLGVSYFILLSLGAALTMIASVVTA